MFARAVLDKLLREDGLAILAKGFSTEKVFSAFLDLWKDTPAAKSHFLLLFVNVTFDEEQHYTDPILGWGSKPKPHTERVESGSSSAAPSLLLSRLVPTVLSADFSSVERSEVYGRGGPIILTTRILVTDLLSGRLPSARTAGLLVHNAHTVTEWSGEAFAIRLLQQRNPVRARAPIVIRRARENSTRVVCTERICQSNHVAARPRGLRAASLPASRCRAAASVSPERPAGRYDAVCPRPRCCGSQSAAPAPR